MSPESVAASSPVHKYTVCMPDTRHHIYPISAVWLPIFLTRFSEPIPHVLSSFALPTIFMRGPPFGGCNFNHKFYKKHTFLLRLNRRNVLTYLRLNRRNVCTRSKPRLYSYLSPVARCDLATRVFLCRQSCETNGRTRGNANLCARGSPLSSSQGGDAQCMYAVRFFKYGGTSMRRGVCVWRSAKQIRLLHV